MSSLQHYGIKGMRWGVRRSLNKNGRYINARKKRYKKETQRYQKGYNEWTNEQDKNNKRWQNVERMYQNIARTPIGRIIKVGKGNTKEAKEYRKAYDEWSEKQDILDEKFEFLKDSYKKTGRNSLHRIFNNIKYYDN